MKSQRRHDLKQNTLDAELAKGVKFLKDHGTRLAWGVLLIALLIFAGVWYFGRASAAEESVLVRYQDAVALHEDPKRAKDPADASSERLIEKFKELADQDVVPRVAAQSAVILGDIYSRQAFVAGPGDEAYVENSDSAKEYYERVVAHHADIPASLARAHLGLGKLAENQRDVAAAREALEAAVAVEGAPGVTVELARKALEKLDTYGGKAFATTAPAEKGPDLPPLPPAPATQPAATQPATAPKAPPATQPTAAPKSAPATKPAPRPAPKPSPPAPRPPSASSRPVRKPVTKPATKPAPAPAPKKPAP